MALMRPHRALVAAVLLAALVGSAATAASATTPTVPGAPQSVKAVPGPTTTTTGPLVVSFTAPANTGGSAITSFTAACTSTNGGVAHTATGTASPLTVANLTTGKTYTCTVRARNSIGTGPASAASAAVGVGTPGPPTIMSAVNDAASTMRVTFVAPPNNGSQITGYTTLCTSSDGGAAATKTSLLSPAVVTGLTTAKAYRCVTRAASARGPGLWSNVSLPVRLSTPGTAPNSIAALGDSLSVGWNSCGSVGSCPAASWSIGTTVDSHYQRILAVNSSISGNASALATPGVPMYSLLSQANAAVGLGSQYITILMGTNDVCRPKESQMTSAATFQTQFKAAMDAITTGSPSTRVFVASIPDLKRIWTINKGNPSAITAWSSVLCKSMFANPASTAPADAARRDRVHQRIVDLNTVLANVCMQYANCKFDGNATFAHQWTPAEMSTIDYIHFASAGEASLAAFTYAAGYQW
jgi:lysophospholipase L1-like esterase